MNKSKEYVLITTVVILGIYKLTGLVWLINIALVIGITGLLFNSVSLGITFFWSQLNRILSLIIPNLLLSCVFYLALTPLAYLSNVFSKTDKLILKNTENSLFKTKAIKFDKKAFEKPY